MAKPIRNTPVLRGKDAERFSNEISQIPPLNERLQERERITQSVNELMSMIASLSK